MRIAVVTANLGHFDKVVDPVKQSVPFDFYRFTDENFPPRCCSMTSRLQARIPKMFMWQMVPGYDYYIWVDASSALLHRDSVRWFLEQCGTADIAVFPHPKRTSIKQEAEYIKDRLKKRCEYIVPRYDNELADDQLVEIQSDKTYTDDKLYHSVAFIYKYSEKIKEAMIQWWYRTSRFHSVDQLAFPYVLWKSGCAVNVIDIARGYNNPRVPYLTFVRYR